MDGNPQITFDEFGKVRVLEAEKFNKTVALQAECDNFVRKISDFGGKVESVVKVLSVYAKKIESEKQRAIGTRILYESANQQLKLDEKILKKSISQEKAKLERLTEEYESLCSAKEDQQKIIDQVTTNDDPMGR